MTLNEALQHSELYTNDAYIPKRTGITEPEFNRVRLVAWQYINGETFNIVENRKEDEMSAFEKRQIKGFLSVFVEGYLNHEEQINEKVGLEGNIKLGDYSKGANVINQNSNLDPNNLTTYPFYKLALSYIMKTNFMNAELSPIWSKKTNQFIGNY